MDLDDRQSSISHIPIVRQVMHSFGVFDFQRDEMPVTPNAGTKQSLTASLTTTEPDHPVGFMSLRFSLTKSLALRLEFSVVVHVDPYDGAACT
jgi:hypothetical protein